MKFTVSKKIILALGVAGICATALPFGAQAKDFTRDEIKAIVGEYLKENPEAILDSLESFRNKAEIERQKQTQEGIANNWSALTDKDAPAIGPVDAKIQVVEFFDYNCGYCKRALPDIQAAVKDNKDVRVVFLEMPILSPGSREAAKWALAAHMQGKYFDYHAALMNHRGPKNAEELKKLGETAGLDAEKLASDAASDAASVMMEKYITLGRNVGVQGTPAFIVNKKFYPGYLGPDGLEDAIKEARKDG